MSWTTVKLADLATVSSGGGAPQDADAFSSEGIPFVRAGSLIKLLKGLPEKGLELLKPEVASAHKLKLFPTGTVLFAKSGMSATKGHIYQLKNPAYVVNHLAALTPRSETAGRFLRHVLRFKSPTCLIKDEAYPSIRLGEIEDMEVPAPQDDVERERIAAILDQAEELRRKRQRAIDRLNQLGQAIFHEMFERAERFPTKEVADFADVKGGKRLPKGAEYLPEPSPHPYIRVSDLNGVGVDVEQIKYISPETQSAVRRYVVHSGDVVISIAGTIGVTAAVPEFLDGANLTENAAKITPKPGVEFDPTYVAWALRMPTSRSQILASTGQVTIGKLALFRIEKIAIPMPDINSQRAFSNAIAKIDLEIANFQRHFCQIDRLFTSLQHRAFRGEL